MPGFTLETEPKIVLLAFRPLLIPVYEALELSVPKAIQIVAENGWEISGLLVSHLIRAEAKKFLKNRACPIEFNDTPRTVTMEQVAMEGLSTKYDGVTVKVLKGQEIPRAVTDPRKEFYQHAAAGLWIEDTIPSIRSLIVLWDCAENGTGLRLQLCCTKDGMARDYWMTPIPHPANWMTVPKELPVRSDDLDDLFEESIKEGIR